MNAPRFTVVVPMFDEQDNVAPLLDELAEVLVPHGPFEALLVDDCSTDATLPRLRAWKTANAADWLRIVAFGARGGQSAATCAGVDMARSDVVMTIDGDLQNDPRDLLRMLEILEAGEADGVCGVRANRRDTVVRRFSSRVGNGVRNLVTGDRVTDAACGIKAFRRRFLLRVPRFAGMHRFLATLVRDAGGRVVELPVNHRPRRAGRAKYGIGNRALRGLHDCFAVRWYRKRRIDYEVTEES
jgi:dolichol-phosphate mannosyltransferase